MDLLEISSKFVPYSIGEVLEDKELLNDIILVRPVEAIPGTTGQQVQNTITIETKGVDASNNPYTTSTNSDNVIKATWLRWGSQRITSPDVRRRMRVMLYRYSDLDEYYWVDMGLDTSLKRLETIVWGINNNPNGDSAPTETPSNMHTLEFSTHTRQITLRTCKSNGEPCGYVFQFNLGAGSVTLADDLGNAVSLDSTEAIWKIKNSFGSFFTMDKNSILAHAAELISLDTKQVQVKAETVNVKAQTFNGDISQLFRMETPQAQITGDVQVGSINTGLKGNSGGMTSNGNMKVEGTISVSSTITCRKLISAENIVAPNVR